MGMMKYDDSTFAAEGRTWRRDWAKPVDEYHVAADLGQSMDHTAVCVIRHQVVPLDNWTPTPSGRDTGVLKQDRTETFDVVHLQRLPIGQSYVDQAAHISELLARPPLNGRCDFAIDQTGCGAAVGDLFDQREPKPIRIVITAGFEPVKHGPRKWAVPKSSLISNLDARLHTGELRFAPALLEAENMKAELADFRRHVSTAGRSLFEARSGAHDDLVLAVSLALWRATGGGKRGDLLIGAATGFY